MASVQILQSSRKDASTPRDGRAGLKTNFLEIRRLTLILDRVPHAVRLMTRLGGALNLREVAFAKLAVEQVQRHGIDHPRRGRIVSSPFVPHEGMGPVEFVPSEIRSSVCQRIVNLCPPFPGNVCVLPAKHDYELPFHLID